MGGQRATAPSTVPDVKALMPPAKKGSIKRAAKPRVRAGGEVGQRAAVVRMRNQAHIEALLDPETVKDWDDEELERGQRKDKNGRFTGRPPKFIPEIIWDERKRRQLDKLAQYCADNAVAMAEVLVKIAENPNMDERARVQAAKLMLDRAAGTPGQHSTLGVTVSGDPAWMKALEAGIVSTDDDIIDAEIIEED